MNHQPIAQGAKLRAGELPCQSAGDLVGPVQREIQDALARSDRCYRPAEYLASE